MTNGPCLLRRRIWGTVSHNAAEALLLPHNAIVPASLDVVLVFMKQGDMQKMRRLAMAGAIYFLASKPPSLDDRKAKI